MSFSINEIRDEWQALNDRTENLERLNASMVLELTSIRTRSITRKYSLWLLVDFGFTLFLYLSTAHYLSGHFGQWSLFLPILSLHILLTVSLIRVCWVLVVNSASDHQLPIVALKRRYAKIGKLTRQFGLFVFVYFLLMHTPLLFWLIEELSGYNVYTDVDNRISNYWIFSQWIFTTLLGCLAFWLFTRHRHHPWIVKLISESAGLAFLEVEKELHELQSFEQDR